MTYFMMARLGDATADTSHGTTIHLTLAMLLAPLLFVKVLVARYYKTYYSLLMPIGLVTFVLSFVLVAIALRSVCYPRNEDAKSLARERQCARAGKASAEPAGRSS